jgi:ATP-binding cassette subfamily F protein 3
MILVNLSTLEKSYGATKILSGITLAIQDGDKLGIIGNNGAGKTTLFNIITGISTIDGGRISTAKDVRIGYLKQTADASGTCTLYEYCLQVFEKTIEIENLMRKIENKLSIFPENQDLLSEYAHLIDNFNQLDGYAYRSRTRGVLFGLGFAEGDFSRPLTTLSGGQRTRLDLARLLLSEYDLLLLDEPTNHLDIDSVNWLENYLSNCNHAYIIISHDRFFLDKTIDKVFEIEMTRGKLYPGNYSQYIDQKRLNYAHDLKHYKKNQGHIKREEELIRHFKETGTAKMARRAKDREHKLERIERIEKPLWLEKNLSLHFEIGIPSGHDVLHATSLSKNFDQTPIFNEITFDIYKGDRIGLIGSNGIGKTTLFKLLIGKLLSDSGTFSLGHHVTKGYYDQEHHNISMENTLFDEIHNLMPMLKDDEVRTYLGSFLFSGDDVFKDIQTLSGGEKARISLLKLMLSGRNFLMLDEPTNHLDIISRETLENAILQFDGTVFAISHDRYFLNRVCDKIFEMTEDGIVEYLGNYDTYTDKKRRMEQLQIKFDENPVTKTQRKQERRLTKEDQQKEKASKKLLKDLEQNIHDQESRLETIHHLQCLEENYSNPKIMQAFSAEIKALEKALEKEYEKWEKFL